MSCLRLRKIKNPLDKSRFSRWDKQYINIPDCKCDKCRKSKKNDWLVRSYFEFTSKDSVAFFVTLDFDEAHLPRYNGVPCFDGKIITAFNERLRYFIPHKFRYLICPDYGDAFNRPHYHAAYIFDAGVISFEEFEFYIMSYWEYGQHTNIQTIDCKFKNPFKAFEYVCKYSLKDFNFDIAHREHNLPYRFRSQVHSSVGYGAQCLDPSEFKSARLIKEGIKFFDSPVITKEYLKNNKTLTIKIDNSDVGSVFAIPRYYELKLAYNYSWDPVEKKASLIRNETGFELLMNRHNDHYIYYREKFLSSRGYGLCNFPFIHEMLQKYFPDSPYNGCMWSDIFDDVVSSPFFDNYIRYKDYLCYGRWQKDSTPFEKSIMSLIPVPELDDFGNKYYRCSSVDTENESISFYLSDFDYNRCIEACFIFDLYNMVVSFDKSMYLDWKTKEDRKAHMRDKIKNNPQYYHYLRRKNFKFNSLTSKNYVSRSVLRPYPVL